MKGLVTEAGRQARSVLCNPRFLGARQHSQDLAEVTASFRVMKLFSYLTEREEPRGSSTQGRSEPCFLQHPQAALSGAIKIPSQTQTNEPNSCLDAGLLQHSIHFTGKEHSGQLEALQLLQLTPAGLASQRPQSGLLKSLLTPGAVQQKAPKEEHSSWTEDTACSLHGDLLSADSRELLCDNTKAHGSM